MQRKTKKKDKSANQKVHIYFQKKNNFKRDANNI